MSGEYHVADAERFLNVETGPIFDVRSPCEFVQGHIPGSLSLPLFTDEERACVGTAYKHEGHDAAVIVGLHAVGPKLGAMASSVRAILEAAGSTSCRITCFRGGMRSRSVQWLCEFLGFATVRLDGGYKAFRRHVLDTFDQPYPFVIIGGYTGSGKTELIHRLKHEGHQTLDLEALACHRGSAFGLLPGECQPTTEQFENLLAQQLWAMDSSRPIFVEDESRPIGSVVIPKGLYDQMDRAEVWWVDVELEKRLDNLLYAYGAQPQSWLIECANKLHRRLGGERVRTVTFLLESGQLREAGRLLLEYYDQTYAHCRSRRQREHTIMKRDEILCAAAQNGSSRTSETGITNACRIPTTNECR